MWESPVYIYVNLRTSSCYQRREYFIDLDKVQGRIRWKAIWYVFKVMGMLGNMLDGVKTFDVNPSACITMRRKKSW